MLSQKEQKELILDFNVDEEDGKKHSTKGTIVIFRALESEERGQVGVRGEHKGHLTTIETCDPFVTVYSPSQKESQRRGTPVNQS